jgi:RNA recognition motif-containing protein
LTRDITSRDLRSVFSRFGKVTAVVDSRNIKRQSSSGAYAFVFFAKKASVMQALKTTRIQLKGATLTVKQKEIRPDDALHAPAAFVDSSKVPVEMPSAGDMPIGDGTTGVPANAIYVTNLSWDTSLDLVRGFFGRFGAISKIDFKENTVEHAGGVRRHVGVLIYYAAESSAEAACVLADVETEEAELAGRRVKIWRTIGRKLDVEDWLSLATLSARIRSVLVAHSQSSIKLTELAGVYLKTFGTPLQPSDYAFPSTISVTLSQS